MGLTENLKKTFDLKEFFYIIYMGQGNGSGGDYLIGCQLKTFNSGAI